jgi:signal transduction histidine kinase
VFASSQQLLYRLLILATVVLLPLFLLTRFWAVASVRRRQQNLLIQQSELRLRELSGRLVKIQEEERRAISREIHDQLGQQVTAINLDLKLAQRESDSAKVGQQLQRAVNVGEKLLESLHEFATRVRPVELDDLGLHDAVESHLQEYQARTGIEFVFTSNVEAVDLPTVVAENVFRLIQESLNNVLKHANATQADVSILLTKTNGEEELNVCIGDNGIGVSNETAQAGSNNGLIEGGARLGMLGMKERVDLLGGTIRLTSQRNGGTSIEATVPLHDSREPLMGAVK